MASAATTTEMASAAATEEASGRYPAQPAGVAWPTEEWATAPLPAGVDAGALDAAVDAGFGAPDAAGRVRAVLIVHDGALVYERYHPLDDPAVATPSYSVAKSVTATLTGMLVDDGRLDPAAPAPVEEWQSPGDPRAAITLDDLLRMSSGLEWEEEYVEGSLPFQMFSAPHAADVAIAQELVAEPGTEWNYSTGTSAIVADILADELGGPDALDAFIDERLITPLGLGSCEVREDATGTYLGGLGFDCTPRDYAKFGLLHARGGLWEGGRLLSEAWIDSTREPTADNEQYGAHWWLFGAPDTFSAQGLFGQQVIVHPGLDVVVVTTATAGADAHAVSAAVLDELTTALTP
jgi:CubicO group peptidase (beta-lactamase class C family)